MNYEKVKTGLLVFLIVLSGVLTWNIWTFQPRYEVMENEKPVNVALGLKQEVKKIVQPDQIVFHTAGKHLGTNDDSEINKIVTMISQWKYYDVINDSNRSFEINQSLTKGRYTELIFPDEVPIELYKKVLNFEDQDLPKFEFDRIIIDELANEGKEGSVYFYSTKNQQAYLSHVSLASINEFSEEYEERVEDFKPFFSHELANGTMIYLPVQEMEMLNYTYYRNPIEPEELKKALFRDPSFVQRSFVTDGEEYTDEASKMTVNNNTNMITYVNPFRESESVVGTENIIQKGIEFINGHSGWTDNYRYAFKDDFNQQVVFRMYSDEGYPIFNQVGLSEIYQEWSQSEIKRFVRPSFQLELPINPEMRLVTMPSGNEIIEVLNSKEELDKELLEDVSLGYYMLKDSQDSSIITLRPGWFYQYDGIWFELILNERVIMNGLESD
ncbi:Two-component signal transduction system YycFG, regulatory protein YycH [Mesobacillus persicus]|uniref:Two-component signal transduction system YycFG, regulatory protein YycH n=1 Tax=Mesobacillus persicus TaxID=930146 RepID=A0A1H8GHT0_9BACI|nr:two-component system activity regulator YycH [Mesobacillus persicus]SEN43325.1 Two-component signal transduction system YycFG, regulatory protein YycH [Mesobacillus persicus]